MQCVWSQQIQRLENRDKSTHGLLTPSNENMCYLAPYLLKDAENMTLIGCKDAHYLEPGYDSDCNKKPLNGKSNHPSIFCTSLFQWRDQESTRAYPSNYQVRGWVQPGQVASPSHGRWKITESCKEKKPKLEGFLFNIIRGVCSTEQKVVLSPVCLKMKRQFMSVGQLT